MDTLTTSPPNEALTQLPAELRIVLNHVSWETYERLLADLSDESAIRLTYLDGKLEIMSPSDEHEICSRNLELIINMVLLEYGRNAKRLGSKTFKLLKKKYGFEPDSCFYIQNFAHVKGVKRIDLSHDPAPDLVVEIDISHSTLDKFAIYSKARVPEIWRHDGDRLRFHTLQSSAYVEVETSLAFPFLSSSFVDEVLRKLNALEDISVLQDFRDWLRKRQQTSDPLLRK
ncbi:MAG: Uma2 family endonuclease [Acidobacteria bacterium]|nr:Uma2 family endonuclease [Acidobacteriota bacterium]MCI0724439.1 Uma2 family endonuclease [Acidobacteriota bacterium]